MKSKLTKFGVKRLKSDEYKIMLKFDNVTMKELQEMAKGNMIPTLTFYLKKEYPNLEIVRYSAPTFSKELLAYLVYTQKSKAASTI